MGLLSRRPWAVSGRLYRLGVPQPPARKILDWTQDAGPVEDWLARWAKAGWVSEYGQGVETNLAGRTVTRWAMIRKPPPLE